MGWTVLTDVEEVVGDEGWDAAGDFMERMIEIYMRAVARPPTLHECTATLEFVYDTSITTYKEKQALEAEEKGMDFNNISKNLTKLGVTEGRIGIWSKTLRTHVSYRFRVDKGKFRFTRTADAKK